MLHLVVWLGPTSAGMIMGFWDNLGYGNLINGTNDWNTNQANIKAMIASEAFINDETHDSNCLADFMSISHYDYGGSPQMAAYGMVAYSDYRGYQNLTATHMNLYEATLTWELFRERSMPERPVLVGCDGAADGSADHFVCAYGYNEANHTYTLWDTWPGDGPQTVSFAPVAEGNMFGVHDIITFSAFTPKYWNSGGTGGGTWSSGGTNWSDTDGGAATTWTNSRDAIFKGATAGVVTISGFTPSVASLQFQTTGYTITGGSLTLADSHINVVAGGTATVNSVIQGSVGLTKGGGGALVLGGNNTYTNLTCVGAANTVSTLKITHANALGNSSSGTYVNHGSTLQIAGGILTAEPLTLNGVGISSAGALRSVSGNNTCSGLITLDDIESGNTVKISCDSGSLTLGNPGTITGEVSSLYLDTSSSITIHSVIGTDGSVWAVGTGTVTLTANIATPA